jgi:CHASE1-domain containing sensor protein
MGNAFDSDLEVHVTIKLDRRALSDLAAALVPYVSGRVEDDLRKALSTAATFRPSAVEIEYRKPL